MKEKILMIWRREKPLIDVWYYIQGNIRFRLYYGKKFLQKLIRRHIREQIDFRIKVMNPTCFNQGSCIKCGCETTELQMADKACEGHCYPHMMSKSVWKCWKNQAFHYYKKQNDV